MQVMLQKKIGTNIDKLIVATNLNDILHRTITTGRYFKDKVYKTHSPSMERISSVMTLIPFLSLSIEIVTLTLFA